MPHHLCGSLPKYTKVSGINDDLHGEAEAREILVFLHLTMPMAHSSLWGQENKQSRHKTIISPRSMKLSIRQTKCECHSSSITNKYGCVLPRSDHRLYIPWGPVCYLGQAMCYTSFHTWNKDYKLTVLDTNLDIPGRENLN